MSRNSGNLKRRLNEFGFSGAVVDAAWPVWWSSEAEASSSAQAELRFSLSRKLGLDPRALLENDEPTFVWTDSAKFKHLSSESPIEQAALNSFGVSVGRILAAGSSAPFPFVGTAALTLRAKILASKQFVSLTELIALCWGIGIPVIHLRVFPLPAKRMCAMSVRIGDRFAILLGKDAEYPAYIAFYLAHELGHIANNHIADGTAIVDLTDPLDAENENDAEEIVADRYALELLTGDAKTEVHVPHQKFNATQLADNLLDTSKAARIEPGALALIYGHTTGRWRTANAAIKRIYKNPSPVWQFVNKVARNELNWEAIPEDTTYYLQAVMGMRADDHHSAG